MSGGWPYIILSLLKDIGYSPVLQCSKHKPYEVDYQSPVNICYSDWEFFIFVKEKTKQLTEKGTSDQLLVDLLPAEQFSLHSVSYSLSVFEMMVNDSLYLLLVEALDTDRLGELALLDVSIFRERPGGSKDGSAGIQTVSFQQLIYLLRIIRGTLIKTVKNEQHVFSDIRPILQFYFFISLVHRWVGLLHIALYCFSLQIPAVDEDDELELIQVVSFQPPVNSNVSGQRCFPISWTAFHQNTMSVICLLFEYFFEIKLISRTENIPLLEGEL